MPPKQLKEPTEDGKKPTNILTTDTKIITIEGPNQELVDDSTYQTQVIVYFGKHKPGTYFYNQNRVIVENK